MKIDPDPVWAAKLAAILAQKQGLPPGSLWEPNMTCRIEEALKTGRDRTEVAEAMHFQLFGESSTPSNSARRGSTR